MRSRGIITGLCLAASTLALGGCVAAAIPVVAGGALFTRGDKEERPEAEAAPEAAAQVQNPVAAVEEGEAELVPAAETVELAAAPGLAQPLEAASGDIEELAAEAGPAPALAAPSPSARPAGQAEPLSLRAYDAFYSYVDSQARRDPVEQERDSALLSAPGLLRPDRTDCSIRPPAVAIDLDPGEQTFDPASSPPPNRMLGQMLNALRLQQVDIFWVSTLPAVRAGEVRRALAAGGLDPDGDDSLLLMRNAEDRKQLRRKEIGETHCLVAIAGDTRGDFDELFFYLKDRSTAQPLEELVGAGWFLTPLPLQEGL
ncbi:hypothetical protein [Erythrobacter sp. HKB08]|uniref:hypothetical protein n=1 Tax=Erythrobacter sp. HKB08 TaxID=2502843 RepID=UPI0010086D1B|nr:hypothetical protein [Erythrobacter sp. HKB08]